MNKAITLFVLTLLIFCRNVWSAEPICGTPAAIFCEDWKLRHDGGELLCDRKAVGL